MSNKGSTFLKQLNSRKNSKILYQKSLKQNQELIKQRKSKYTYVVDIKDNNEVIVGDKREIPPKETIIVKTKGNIVSVQRNEKIKHIKTTKDEVETLKSRIKEEVLFEQRLEDINEQKIKKQLEKVINEDKKKIALLNEQIDKIKNQTSEYQLSENVENLVVKIKKIKETLENIKSHYTIISDYYDFKGYEFLKNEILLSSIEDYCFYQNEVQIEQFVKNCKNEGKKINSVIETYEKCLKSEEKIIEIKDKTTKRDSEFKEYNNKVLLAESCHKKIIENFDIEDDFIKKINTDLYYIEKKIDNNRIFTKSKSLFNNLFNMAMCTTLMPILPSFRMFIQLILLKNAAETTNIFLNNKVEKTFTTTILNEYLSFIFDKEKLVLETEKLLKSTTKDIKEIKNNYINKFSSYSNVYKEYDLYLEKLGKIEKQLLEKQKELDKVRKALENNKTKIKALKKD